MKALLQALSSKMKEKPQAVEGKDDGSDLAPSLGASESGDSLDLGALINNAEAEQDGDAMKLQEILAAIQDSSGPGGGLRARAAMHAKDKMK